jgi:hypothetical protein
MWIFVIDARFCARRGYQGGHATTAAAHDTAQMQIDATFALFSLLMLALSLLLPAPTPRHRFTATHRLGPGPPNANHARQTVNESHRTTLACLRFDSAW